MKKKSLIFVMIMALPFLSYSQSETFIEKKNTIKGSSLDVNVRLISNRYIYEDKLILIEERLKNTFPELLEISINLNTQKVEMKLMKNVSQETINKIITYFKTDNYEVY